MMKKILIGLFFSTSVFAKVPAFVCDILMDGKLAGQIETSHDKPEILHGKYHYTTKLPSGKTVESYISQDGKGKFVFFDVNGNVLYGGDLECQKLW